MVDWKKSSLVASLGSTAILAGVLGVSTSARAASLMQVTPTSDPTTLANAILGSGVTISNPTYTGAPVAAGVFSNGNAAGLGIDTGILLTSGEAADAANASSTSNIPSTGNGTPGDPQLSALLPGNPSTYDASELTFNFSLAPGTDSLFFKYIFASTEYPQYVNSEFNDVFGFFVDGKNIALLPGTNTAVSINTVNGGNPLGTNTQNPNLYVNNFPGSNVASLPNNGTAAARQNIAYHGFTVPLTATITGLTPGQHTIKLAVADTSDDILDSAVFIQGNSFSNTSNPSPTPPVGSTVPEPSASWGLLAFVGLAARYSLAKCRAIINIT
jgi:hypothetical protein